MASPEYFSFILSDRLAVDTRPSYIIHNLKNMAPHQAGLWRAQAWTCWSADAPAITGVWGGNIIIIPAQTKHPEEAKAFLDYFGVSIEGQEVLFTVGTLVPGYLPALKSEKLREPEPFLGGQILMDIVTQREVSPFNYHHWIKIEEIFGTAIDDLFSGRKTPDQVWDYVQEMLSRL